jgi:hypothetical protein
VPALAVLDGVKNMKRRLPKARKKHAEPKRPPKSYRLRAEPGRFKLTGHSAELVHRTKQQVEEALANLPPGALSERQAEDIHRNISVATDEAAKPKDRKTALESVIKICGAIKVTDDAVQGVHNLWEHLRKLGELILQ